MSQLTHLNERGQAHMVDVGHKPNTHRQAIATGFISMTSQALHLLTHHESKKGDVIATARIAAIQACKQTSQLIPLCHPIALSHVNVDFKVHENKACVQIIVTTETVGSTGVEMEALTGVSVGLLTIYDMLKAVDREMVIQHIQLIKKQGGKSGLLEISLPELPFL